MALNDKKYGSVHNRTGDSKVRLKANYDQGHINTFADLADDGVNPEFGALIYMIQEMQEELDYLRTEIATNKGKTGINTSQASAITANTAKRTSPTWVPSSNPSYLTSSSTQSKYLRSDAGDSWTGKLTWAGSDYADGINMSLGNINDAHYIKANEFKQRLSGIPRNNLGDPTVTEMALFEEQFGPKTTLANDYDDLSDLTFWSQETSSSNWVEITSYSDTHKRRFLRTNNSSVIIPSGHYKFRVEFTAKSYTFANAMYMYWSSNSHNTQVHIWKKRCSDGAWLQHTSATNTISSWPGHGWLHFSTIPWHETNTTSTGHYTDIRVEFTPNWSTGSNGYRDINLYGMQIWGGYPRGRRTPHYYDENGEFNFLKDAHLKDGKFLKLGTGNDLKLYHDGSNSYIDESGTGILIIKASNSLALRSATDENYIYCTSDGNVRLYYNNSQKLETTSAGVEVSGSVTASNLIGTPANANTHSLTLGRTDNSNYWNVNHAGNDFRLYNTASSGSDILLGVDSGGTAQANKVGIGTATPGQKLDVVGNIAVSGTVDGRDVATDGTKLDTIATNADATPSWVPSSDPGYGTSNLALGTTSTTALAGDTVTITTAQAAILTNLANLPTRRGASGTFWNNRGMLSVS